MLPSWDDLMVRAAASSSRSSASVSFRLCRYLFQGGAAGSRTPDLRRAKAALSQLSYGPKTSTEGDELRAEEVFSLRLSPASVALSARCGWGIVDSNHRPRSYQDRALTT